jgi:lipid II isoglutaminyl synthase (glutamine-hydrolysing)
MTEGAGRHAVERDEADTLILPIQPGLRGSSASARPARPAPPGTGRHAAPVRVPRQANPLAAEAGNGAVGDHGSANGRGQAGSPSEHPAASARPSPEPAAAAETQQRRPASAGSASKLRVVWVYPDLLSTYGDRGNLLVLSRRARLRGIEVESIEVNSDQRVPGQGDIYLLGGGEDLPQILAARRLSTDGGLAAAVSHGSVVFAVCAGYQVVGHRFGGVDGEPVDGLGLLDITSGRGDRRGVGELVAEADPALGVPTLTGFENHQGVTSIGPGARPLARLSQGVGNGDGTEGAYAGRVLGTYLHGPALARNPGLADLLLSWAAGPLAPIDPAAEEWAARLRAERLRAVAQ